MTIDPDMILGKTITRIERYDDPRKLRAIILLTLRDNRPFKFAKDIKLRLEAPVITLENTENRENISAEVNWEDVNCG